MWIVNQKNWVLLNLFAACSCIEVPLPSKTCYTQTSAYIRSSVNSKVLGPVYIYLICNCGQIHMCLGAMHLEWQPKRGVILPWLLSFKMCENCSKTVENCSSFRACWWAGVCVLSHIFSALQLLPLNCKGSCGLGWYTHDKDAMVWFLRESLLKLVLQRTI